jgi:hypothetical protein
MSEAGIAYDPKLVFFKFLRIRIRVSISVVIYYNTTEMIFHSIKELNIERER